MILKELNNVSRFWFDLHKDYYRSIPYNIRQIGEENLKNIIWDQIVPAIHDLVWEHVESDLVAMK